MTLAYAKLVGWILTMTVTSGIADAQGFIHAGKIWQNGKADWAEVGKSALGFAIGIAIYWRSLKHMNEIGVVTPEIQTLVWFGVTLVGVAALSGRALRWPMVDQAVAVAVLVGIGWLLFRTAG